MRTLFRLLFVLLWFCPVALRLSAQLTAGMDVQGDEVNFEGGENTVVVRGNAVIRKGDQKLEADEVRYNTQTEVAVAKGNVVFTNADQIWRGEELTYNFITGEGSFPELELVAGPFTVNARAAERVSEIQTTLTDVVLTTCAETEDPDFAITASRVDVYENEVFLLRNVVFNLHGVPFFYLPRFTLDQRREPTHIDVMPGYGSRDGVYLLTTVNRHPSEGFRSETQLDYRMERGPGIGQNFVWYDPLQNREHTRFDSYFLLDDAPYDDVEEEEQLRGRGVDIDEERYRLKFFHRNDLGPNDTLWVEGAYLSDSRVVQDFFDEEYRREPVPETRASYSAVGEGWSATVDLNRQLNDDMFDSINRLPEASVLIPRQRLGGSRFLYGSETRAGFLERTYADTGAAPPPEGYESTRLHTEHMVYYPTRQFGWLSLVPRAGIAATHYSETVEERTTVTPAPIMSGDGLIVTSLETNVVREAQSGDLRLLPEIGIEGSFKSFGIVHDEPTTLGQGLRHVVEPFADYTLIPEPDLTPDRIYQFDDIDARGEEHSIGFGVRNKWQTRRELPNGRRQVIDMVNLGARSELDLRSDAENTLGDVIFDLDLRLVDWAWARLDARVDTDDGALQTADAELRFQRPGEDDYLMIHQRFRDEDRHTVQLFYGVNPKGRVGWRGMTRYELEDDGLEEQQLMLTFRTECVGYAFGGKWIKGDEFADGTTIDDEYEIWLQIWLTAFPRAVLGRGMR